MDIKLLNVTSTKFNFFNKCKIGVEYDVTPEFKKRIEKLSDNIYELYLGFSLVGTNGKESPYDLELEIKGTFELNKYEENELKDFLESNAIAIVFPYLRTTISTTMSALMINPLVLPVVNAKLLFKESK